MVSPRAARLGTAVVAVAACVNIAIGLALIRRDPSRAADLWTMYEWTRSWIWTGAHLYGGVHDAVDYPPNAIVLLSPLGLLPRSAVVPVWTIVGLALAAVLPCLAARCALPRRDAAVVAVLLCLCWTSMRTLLQFTTLSLTLAFASARIADARPSLSGVALGLALFKPHIAGPFALWTIVSGRVRVFATAVAVVACGIAVYSIRIGESPVATLRGYGASLVALYSGGNALYGRTSIREPIAAAVGDDRLGDAIWIGAAVCLVAVAVWLACRDRRRPLRDGGVALPALFCLCSLAAIYHNINNLILMLPAFLLLWFAAEQVGFRRRAIQIACLQLVLMVDVPTRVTPFLPRGSFAALLNEHFDRLLVLACFVDVAAAWLRITRAGINRNEAIRSTAN